MLMQCVERTGNGEVVMAWTTWDGGTVDAARDFLAPLLGGLEGEPLEVFKNTNDILIVRRNGSEIVVYARPGNRIVVDGQGHAYELLAPDSLRSERHVGRLVTFG